MKSIFLKGYVPKVLVGFIFALFFVQSVSAQYFGQNKPRYKSFDFEIQSSNHFDLYHYLDNKEVIDDISKKSEQWYAMHRAILRDSFTSKNPIILYNNHPDFQQTNTISGSIGVGTGGVTEAFKNRVVFPLTFTNEQTNHVLGHEMVHAFQYNMILNGDSTNIENLSNLPLWMIEGLAEYMSKGKEDPFTSMWMRSSIINDDIPTFRDLQNPKYFPYRYGQAFWAYVSSVWGDEAIRPLFMNTAKFGLAIGMKGTLGINPEQFEENWHNALKEQFTPFMAGKKTKHGKVILNKENSGQVNVSPSLSPNGKYITFWSEKDVLETSLFLAEAQTGKIVRKITSDSGDGHLDAINFLEAAGTWSSDSKKFAFVGIKKGENVIIIKDVSSGKTLETISVKGVPAFTHLAWRPKSKSIVLTGLVNGQVDLYEVDTKTKKVTQLTNDNYSEIMSHFNEDGSKLAFATDRNAVEKGRMYGHYSFDIAVMDYEYLDSEILDIFPGADNVNPSFDHEGNLLFLSNRDGFRNIYKYTFQEEKLEQLTDIKTGVSGITDLAPALTVSTRRDRIIYSMFNNFEYTIQRTKYEDLEPFEVDKNAVDFSAGTLVKNNPTVKDAVNANIENQDAILASLGDIETKDVKYKPKYKLDYVGGGAGVGVNNGTFGNNTGLAGGIQLLFSDQLGDNQIFTNLSVNGEIFDAGGQISYLNRKNKIAWGVGLGHIPLQTGFAENPVFVQVTDNVGNVFDAIRQDINIIRVFNESLNVFAHFPFSKYIRLEGGISGGYQSFRWDEYQNIYVDNGFNLQLIDRVRERIETPDEIVFNQFYTVEKGFQTTANVAFVGDNSVFGMTSPLKGYRFRISAEQHFGINRYTGLLVDARKYFWLKPVSLAFRTMSFTRIDQADDNNVFPFYIGQQGWVRGYGSAFTNFQTIAFNLEQRDINFGQVIGANMGLVSAEVRLPFTGPRSLALIPSKFFMSDLMLFFDSGVAYNAISDFSSATEPYLTMSTGIGARFNLLGYIIVEPYYAYLPRENAGTFGFNLVPGW
jgi:hypothetical protein